MVPIGSILERYGLTVGQVAASASRALSFGEAYEMTRNYVTFTSQYRRAFPGSTVAQAREAYQIGKYWYEQGAALSQIDPSQVIPPSLARVTGEATRTIGVAAPYRYAVKTSFTDPRTGTTKVVWNYVVTAHPASQDEVFELAEAAALEVVRVTPPFAVPHHEMPSLISGQEIESFTRYSPGA